MYVDCKVRKAATWFKRHADWLQWLGLIMLSCFLNYKQIKEQTMGEIESMVSGWIWGNHGPILRLYRWVLKISPEQSLLSALCRRDLLVLHSRSYKVRNVLFVLGNAAFSKIINLSVNADHIQTSFTVSPPPTSYSSTYFCLNMIIGK